MPLTFNRNFQSLLNLTPGATRAFRPHSEFFNSQDSLYTQVNGQSRLANNVQIEGIDNNHRTGLLTVLIPPIEALSSVDITTSNYEAELGREGAQRLQPVRIHAGRADHQEQDILLRGLSRHPRSPRRCDASYDSHDGFSQW